ncbi:hypothetical protein BX600DRAFT_437614 [Xylariales sp. PMI_506]|nr:hypothetical protein BX600DRAFT_437614 [Xylariales sp. PMI_506]
MSATSITLSITVVTTVVFAASATTTATATVTGTFARTVGARVTSTGTAPAHPAAPNRPGMSLRKQDKPRSTLYSQAVSDLWYCLPLHRSIRCYSEYGLLEGY